VKHAFLLGALLALGLGLASTAMAQEGLGAGSRPKSPQLCMTEAEFEAEAVVRSGIVLRAYARDCARRGIDGSILPQWSAFDAANAEQLRNAVELRSQAYARNYPNDAYAGQRVIDEILTSRGIVHPSAQECLAVANVVGGLTSWDDFLLHARRTELGQVKTQFRRCPRKGGGVGTGR